MIVLGDMTTRIAAFAQRIGLKLTRAWRYPQCDANMLELAVPALLSSRGSEFFFVQVGASDGVTNDPLYALITRHNLRGICVEPLPSSFSRLQHTHAGNPNVTLENAAIAESDGSVKLVAPEGYDARLYIAQKSSLRPECVRKHFGKQARLREIEVAGLTFASLCRKHAVKAISLLQVDTEGFDYEVIRQSLAVGILPDAIHYESLHLTKREMEFCRLLLRANGYRLIESTVDTLAWKGPARQRAGETGELSA